MLTQNPDSPSTSGPTRRDEAAQTISVVLLDDAGAHCVRIAKGDVDGFIRDELIGPWAEVCEAVNGIHLWSARPGIGAEGTYINELATGLLRALVLAVLGGDYPGNLDHPNLAADMLVFGFPPIVGPCLIVGTDDAGDPSPIPEQFVRWTLGLARTAPSVDATASTVTSEHQCDFQDEPPF